MKLEMTWIPVASVALLVAACGGSDSESTERQLEKKAAAYGVDADVTVDESGDVSNVVINSSSGAKVGNNLDLPDGFPSDLILPDSWSILSTSPVPPDGFMVTAQSTDSAADIAEAISASMTGNGWTGTADQQPSPQMRQIGYEKDGRMANFNLIVPDGPVSIQLMTMTKPG